jgi:hypothetical protein
LAHYRSKIADFHAGRRLACKVCVVDSSIGGGRATACSYRIEAMNKPDNKIMAFPAGIALGVALGAAAGFAIDNVMIGIGVGTSLALVFGMLLRVMRIIGASDEGPAD